MVFIHPSKDIMEWPCPSFSLKPLTEGHSYIMVVFDRSVTTTVPLGTFIYINKVITYTMHLIIAFKKYKSIMLSLRK